MISKAEYQALLRSDLSTFIQRSFYHLSPGGEYLHNWHIDLIAQKLKECADGRIKRLIINMPPRNLKSICASVGFPAWILGRDASKQILCVSYGQDLSEKHARDCMSIMGSDWYQDIFPTRISKNKQSVQEFLTTKRGARLSTSIGGVLTGRGADIIIIDDPLKPEEAISETSRKRVNDWYNNTLYSRLNSKENGCIIVIMQRLHEDDLTGYLMQEDGWEVLSLPSMAEEYENYQISTALKDYKVIRNVGDALHPERESAEILTKMRNRMGEYNFAGQYQQRPTPMEGGLVKRKWFNLVDELPDKYDSVIHSWDTASKATEISDYSVCTIWGIKGKNIYLIHVFRDRLEFPELERKIRSLAQDYSPKIILIEDKASGIQLLQKLKNDGIRQIKAIKPEGDKVMRMNEQTATIENGFVHLPKNAAWLDLYLHEMTVFPYGKNDDQVDSTSQALHWFNQSLLKPQFNIRVI